MGGNAIKNTRRVPLSEYEEIKRTLINKLTEFGYAYVLDIPHIGEKKDFGDLDLLLPKPKLNDLSKYLSNYLNSKEVKINGDIISFEYRNFQVDLIHVSEENIKLHQTYFSYNDLGMLMGVLAKRIRCKYGGDGLYYRWYSKNLEKRRDILLSKDPKIIFEVLGLSFSRFKKGFSTFREMFEFVRTSPLFDTQSFVSQENWNHRRRTRNNKRKTWHDFVEYCRTNTLIENLKPYNCIDYISRFFDIDLYGQIKKIEEEEQRKNLIKRKFNGNLVNEITGLQGKELGYFINSFKNSKKDFENWVITSSDYNIRKEIINFYF